MRLSQVPLFKDCEEAFIRYLVMKLKLHVYLQGEIVFHMGDVGHEMYFISKVRNGGSSDIVLHICLSSAWLSPLALSTIPFLNHLMCCNIQGHVAVLNGNYELLAMLGQGGFFGELGLLVRSLAGGH